MTARARHRGMTLVEVIVSLAILSMVVVVLGASVRGMGESGERVDAQIERSDQMRGTAAFLRELMTRASFQRNAGTGQAQYVAGPGEFAWVGSMPPRVGGTAGRHFFRLALETAEGAAPALVLRFAPWQEGAAADWARAESRVIVAEVTGFQLAYGGAGFEQGWADRWNDAQALPPRVRLTLATASQQWPPLVMPIRTLQGTPGLSFGGGS
jgi:general secretion pathway protein J